MTDNKDVPENSQPAYDDYQTRMLLVQVDPGASVSKLEETRAWIAGEVSIAHRVREVLDTIQGQPINSPSSAMALESIAEIVAYREHRA